MLLKNGKIISAAMGEPFALARGYYSLEFDGRSNSYYLSTHDGFNLPKKLYGFEEIQQDCARWLGAFERSHKNIGVSLVGIKGSGKTVTSQYLCSIANKPVIVISKLVVSTEAFLNFMSQPELKDSIVFIDEFEKTFGKQGKNDDFINQDEESILPLLQLMDGNYATRFLFLLTSNRPLNDLLKNRLGRIRYRKVYESLSEKAVTEYFKCNLVSARKKDAKEAVKLISALGFATYDLLTHFTDELNHTTCDLLTCLNSLNIEPETTLYDIAVREVTSSEWFECFPQHVNLDFGKTFQLDTYRYNKRTGESIPEDVQLNCMKIPLQELTFVDKERTKAQFGKYLIRFTKSKTDSVDFGVYRM